MRFLVSRQFRISYDDAKPAATLQDLGCDELDVVELIMEIEDQFEVTITDEEFDALGENEDWQQITILGLANLVRGKTVHWHNQ